MAHVTAGRQGTPLIVGWNWFWLQLIGVAALGFKNLTATLVIIAFLELTDVAYGWYMRQKYPNAPIYRKKAQSE